MADIATEKKPLDVATLKTQDKLSDEQEAQLRADAQAELDEADGAGDKSKDDDTKDDGDAVEKTDDEKAEEKETADKAAAAAAAGDKPKEEAPKDKTDDELIAADDKDLSEPEKAKKKTIVDAKAFDADVKALAESEKIEPAKAKEILESERKLGEKYGVDPTNEGSKKMLRAMRHLRTQVSTQGEELKTIKDQAERSGKDVFLPDLDEKGEPKGTGKWHTWEEGKPKMIEAYREMFPDKTREMSDDAVFDNAKSDYMARVKVEVAGVHEKFKADAGTRRAKIIQELPADHAPYKDTIKKMLETTPDRALAHPDFDAEDIILWSRGQYFSPDAIKKLQEEAFNKGQEKAKILGVKGTPAGGGAGGAKDTQGKITTLTLAQKERALAMFDGQDQTDEWKYEALIEILEDERKSEAAKAQKKGKK